jgi:rare lipoprotein A (peptidoglycan hydrolase)
VGGRIIDVSSGAAGELGMRGSGVAKVRVTTL